MGCSAFVEGVSWRVTEKEADVAHADHAACDFVSHWESAEERVKVFLRAVVYCAEDRKDLQQEVAQKAFCAFHTFSPLKGSFVAWTLGIARNELLHYLRSRRRACVLFDSELAERVVEFSSPGEEDESRAVHMVLRQEVDRLPDDRRNLLRMKYVDNLTCLQIAQRLSTTESAVKMRLNRVRSRLKRKLLPFI